MALTYLPTPAGRLVGVIRKVSVAMAVTTTDAKRILTTDLAPLIRRVQDVARRRLGDVETQSAREGFASDYANALLDAAERGEPRPPKPDREWHDEKPEGISFWWDEPCWGELIHALRSYSLDGQAAVLEQHLRHILPDPQAVVRPTIDKLHEAERLALREILQLCEQWLAPAPEVESNEKLDHLIERLQTTVGASAGSLGRVVDESTERPEKNVVDDQSPTEKIPQNSPIKRPSDKALKAWRLRDLSGIDNQSEIAKKMTEMGVPATQGQVSRWLKEAEEYLDAGKALPTLDPLTSQPSSVDPEIIEMGERQDRLTPRQREDRSDDSDD